jgi:hypothetical protein
LNENEKLSIDNKKALKFNSDVNQRIKNIADDLEKNKGSKEKIAEIIKNGNTKISEIAKNTKMFTNKQKITEKEWQTKFNKNEFNEMKVRDIKSLKMNQQSHSSTLSQKNQTSSINKRNHSTNNKQNNTTSKQKKSIKKQKKSSSKSSSEENNKEKR